MLSEFSLVARNEKSLVGVFSTTPRRKNKQPHSRRPEMDRQHKAVPDKLARRRRYRAHQLNEQGERFAVTGGGPSTSLDAGVQNLSLVINEERQIDTSPWTKDLAPIRVVHMLYKMFDQKGFVL